MYVAIAAVACKGDKTAAPPASAAAGATSPTPAVDAGAARAEGDAAPPPGAGAPGESADEAPARPSITEVAEVLFLGAAEAKLSGPCPVSVPTEARFRCLFDERYRGDAKAASLAYELWSRHAIVAGVAPKHTMDGGYRGMIALEPAVPVAADRKHLEWMVTNMKDFESFFASFAKAADAGAPPRVRFRFRPLRLRFMRSTRGRTPSAYANDWSVSYNLAGSLWRSVDAARETMFHEIFHDNDDDWSPRALGEIYRGILAKCGTRVPCLGPYAPSEIQVRGGTYYSFQPNNGDSVREYAADLATRFFRENRDTLAGAPPKKPFKCGPPENARAWGLMRDAYFGGQDLVPACP
jgi:hypothetical protein